MNVSGLLTPAALLIASAMFCFTFRYEVIDRSSGFLLYDRLGGSLTSCTVINQRFSCRVFESSRPDTSVHNSQ
jgi:hypothetical protein